MLPQDLIDFEFQSLSKNYFNSPYFGPLPRRAQIAAQKAVQVAANPVPFPYEAWRPLPDEGRQALAKLLTVNFESISHHGSVSEVISIISLGLKYKEKETIVLMEGDYPSNVLPWMLNKDRSAYSILKLPEERFRSPDKLANSLPADTKVLNISHVMFNTGRKNNILEIGKICQDRGILFIVDVTQSFGGMQLSPEEVAVCDVIVGATYKWLLSPYGHAFGYWSDRAVAQVQNTHLSWQVSAGSTPGNLLNYTTEPLPGARRFDRGQAPNLLGMKSLISSLSLFDELGLQKVEAHNAQLTGHFLENYPKNDFQLVTPQSEKANIICLRQTSGNSENLQRSLQQKNIHASVREGNLRLGFHLFNTTEEIETLIKALAPGRS